MRRYNILFIGLLTLVMAACGQLLDVDQWEKDTTEGGSSDSGGDSESDSDTGSDSQTDSGVDSSSETASDSDSAPDPDTESESETESDSDTGPAYTTCETADNCGAGGNCVDGYCCDSPCDGRCESCSVSGSEGVCTPYVEASDPENECSKCQVCNGAGACAFVAKGEDPLEECVDDSAQSCGQNGTCNGSGACSVYAAGTSCGDATCSNVAGDDSLLTEYLCDGQGNCQDSAHTCGGYLCNVALNGCLSVCPNDGFCVDGFNCSPANACIGSKPIGDDCWLDEECGVAGNCVDGYCCNSSCDAPCETCDQAGSEGTCLPVVDFSDPKDDCPTCYSCQSGACVEVPETQDHVGDCAEDPDPLGCGLTGRCDGAGSCAFRPTDWSCGPQTCTDDVDNLEPSVLSRNLCDGSGNCGAVDRTCGTFTCGEAQQCLESCVDAGECVGESICVSGECTDEKPNGDLCEKDFECGSGICVDGVCCGTACDGDCARCDIEGSEGTCSPVPSGSDPDEECEKCSVCLGGACAFVSVGEDPKDDCLEADAGTCGRSGVCAAAGECQVRGTDYLCATECTGNEIRDIYCDGTIGGCNQPDTAVACVDSFMCAGSGDVCLSECAEKSDCADGFYCDSSASCQPEMAAGTLCNIDDQCGTGFCVDGYCCDDACDGTCESCNQLNVEGTCTAAPMYTDPDGECPECYACNDLQACAEMNNQLAPEGDCLDFGTCGHTGMCLVGSCEWTAQGAPCDTNTCQDQSNLPSEFTQFQCDGVGSCDAIDGTCGAYLCASGDTCLSACTDDDDCVGDAWCNGDVCSDSRPAGDSCLNSTDCESGNCVDGVCCTQSDCGTCARCDLSGDGTCQDVMDFTDPDGDCETCNTCQSGSCVAVGDGSDPSGDCSKCEACYGGVCDAVPAGDDPMEDCTEDADPSGCGLSGACDGASACQWRDSTYLCNETCEFPQMFEHHCDGGGVCLIDASGGYCDGDLACATDTNSCLTGCSTNAHCAPSAQYYCDTDAGTCAAKGAQGDACSENFHCLNSQCTDGVCCDTACTGGCMSCKGVETDEVDGICAPIISGQDPDAECEDDNWCTGADYCDGGGACVSEGNPCVGGDECNNECHDGAGSQDGHCFNVNGTSCGDSNTDDCDSADTCDGAGTCLLNHAVDGADCDDGSFCTENDLCDGAGQCVGTGDPCASGDACTNSCNEGADNCYSPMGTMCGDATDTTCNGADTCDGSGGCLDNFAATSTVCRNAGANECDVTEYCDGSGNCPIDAFEKEGVSCDDSVWCSAGDVCDGNGACEPLAETCVKGICDETEQMCSCNEGFYGEFCDTCIVYVDVNGVGGDGSSWTKPLKSLQEGVVAAHDSGCGVWVAQGTYPVFEYDDRTLQLAEGVEVYGGFTNGDVHMAERDVKANRTVLNGAGMSDHVVTCDGNYDGAFGVLGCDDGTLLDGFLVTGGVAAKNSSLPFATVGGGVLVGNSEFVPVFRNLTIYNNAATEQGGGAAVYGAGARFEHCLFSGNNLEQISTEGGALMAADAGQVDVINCEFVGNASQKSGGAIFAANAGLTLENVVAAGNLAGEGNGGFALLEGTGTSTFTNTTIVNNRSNSGGGSGVYLASGKLYVFNSILWGNTRDDEAPIQLESKGECNAAYSDAVNGVDAHGCNDSEGNISEYPEFKLYKKNSHMEGDWEQVYYDADADVTVLRDSDVYHELGSLEGLYVQPDVVGSNDAPRIFKILANDAAYEVEVLGDITALVKEGNRYKYYDFDIARLSPVIDMGDQTLATEVADIEGVGRVDISDLGRTGEVNDMGAYELEETCVVYMDPTGNGDGTIWTNAEPDLQNAIDQAWEQAQRSPDGTCMVWATSKDPIDYPQSLYMRDGVHLYGGFLGGESDVAQLNPDAVRLHLNGSTHDSSIMICDGANGVRPCGLDTRIFGVQYEGAQAKVPGGGLFVAGGAYPQIVQSLFYRNTTEDNGGGISAVDASVDLVGCVFDSNESGGAGGALAVEQGASGNVPTRIRGCVFLENHASIWGGAIAALKEYLSVLMADNRLSRNHAVDGGGAVWGFNVANLALYRNWFDSNWAGNVDYGPRCLGETPNTGAGGAVGLKSAMNFSTYRLYNNVFYNSRAMVAGAFFQDTSGSAELYHNTFFSNCADNIAADVVGTGDELTTDIYNSVFYRDPADDGMAENINGVATTTVYQSFVGDTWKGAGYGNLDESFGGCTKGPDEIFESPIDTSLDLRPGETSCLIDAGYPYASNLVTPDIVGTVRYDNPGVPDEAAGLYWDLGAYER